MKTISHIVLSVLLSASHLQSADDKKPAPREQKFVTIIGEVRNPGRFPWSPNLTLMSAVPSAVLSGFRVPHEITITRGNQKIVAYPRQIKKGTETDPKLQPGDIITVPEE